MTHFIDSASVALMAKLATSVARSFLLAGIAVIVITIFRLKATSHRLFVWTLVLYASFALPVLEWMLPSLQIPVPGFVQETASNRIQAMQPRTPASPPRTARHTEIRFAGSDQLSVSVVVSKLRRKRVRQRKPA